MATTTRRHLLRAAALGGVSATGLAVLSSPGVTAAEGEQKPGNGNEHAHDNRPQSGKRAITVVSFGQWDADSDAPYDRQPINSDRTRNIHLQIPFVAEVDAGGAVSFQISGLHQIVIYGNNRKFLDLRADWLAAGAPVVAALPPPPPGGLPPLVDFATDRVYRGLDPRVLQYAPVGAALNIVQDRVETVNFKSPGRYLVVCGVVPHFNVPANPEAGMHGYIRVKA